ncbi:MAG: ATP-dependent DNA ligase [Gemmatimonadales bacterium]|nr:MAG: ATP-dependent DNA ligase [Gemmatimonadales bacterium]
MKRFTTLFNALDSTTRTSEKIAALRAYFQDAPPADAAWALWVLSGERLRRSVSTRALREWVARRSHTPLWLVEECYDAVGDLAETLALLLPPPDDGKSMPGPEGAGVARAATHGEKETPPLHKVMEEWIAPLRSLTDQEREERLNRSWDRLRGQELLVFHKLLTGGFRVGVGKKLVTRALAETCGMDPAVLAHRMTGRWDPTAEAFLQITSPDADLPDPGRPYPFFLAHSLDGGPEELPGPPEDWLVEWKWDGIRGQLIHRRGETLIWSRGEELVTPAFPELAEAARVLPSGTVLDGEILAWGPGGPRPFADLQRRLGRKRVGARLRGEVPVIFLAYDLLEAEERDLREQPLQERRRRLSALLEAAGIGSDPAVEPASGVPLALSPPVTVHDWAIAHALRDTARTRGVEGLMIKARASTYGVGRRRGPWWKWKVDPLTLDAVLLYAQRGHGRRASLYTDYTFGVWADGELVPVGKAYSGLTDAEIREVDRWIRRNIVDRFGPVRAVEPELVFELAFDGIRESSRHRSGLALRFPRMARWRQDKPPEEADTLEAARALLRHSRGEP